MKRSIICALMLSCVIITGRTIQGANPPLPLVVEPSAYGAKADGKENDAKAIQKAIDFCTEKGGGTVLLKEGIFLSGPIEMKNNVTLEIGAKAVLSATTEPDAYKNPEKESKNSKRKFNAMLNFIYANDAHNIAITGTGVIDGNGKPWWDNFLTNVKKDSLTETGRPRLIYFMDSKNITIKDVSLKDSPSFHIVPNNCDNVTITRIKITAPADSPNTDGIDPSGSRDVVIDGCIIDTGDDNIAIKAGNEGMISKNTLVKNCTFLHGHGMSIGSETNGNVFDVTVENCSFKDTTNGMRIKSPRKKGGIVKNIRYNNITMENVEPAIFISGYYPNVPQPGKDKEQPVKNPGTPDFQDIVISNVKGTARKNVGLIIGLPEAYIKNVTLDNVNITAPKGLVVRNAKVTTNKTMFTTTNGPAIISQENAEITAKPDVK